jgi:hypothetical protein
MLSARPLCHAAPLLLLMLGACSDQLPTVALPPAGGGPLRPSTGVMALSCAVTVATRNVRCSSDAGATAARRVLVGGQNVYVTLASSNVAYESGSQSFHFDVTVRNLMAQPIGTADGFTLSTGVLAVFHDAPTATAGTGEITVDSADGTGTFTAAGQPYYAYPEVLYTGDTSSPRTWWLTVPNTVEEFGFVMLIQADVPAEPGVLRYVRESGTPTTDNLRGVWASSPSNVYAVGGYSILRFDGTRWKTDLCGCFGPMFGIYGLGPADILAVGDFGTILHWDGTTWENESLPDSLGFPSLRGVWGATADSVWAVGLGGALFLKEHGSWVVPELEVGFTYSFNAVSGRAWDDVWAVGANGRIIHYDGDLWSEMPRPSTNALFGVWAASDSSAWAVGSGGRVIHYDGTAWSVVAAGIPVDLRAVWGSSDADVWVSGVNGAVYHYQGASWDPVASGTPNTLHALWGSGPGDIHAVGASGAAIRWNGAEWTGITDNMRSVWGTGSGDLWAVGFNGAIAHSDGSGSWTREASGTALNLRGVWGSSADSVFAVGLGGTLLLRTGGSWAAQASPTASDLHGVWGRAPDDVFAVGTGGEILHFDGGGWSAQSSGTLEALHAVAGTADSVWAVGDAGTVLRYDGANWAPESTGVPDSLYAIWIGPDGEPWAGGTLGTVLHRVAGVWGVEYLPIADINALWGTSSSDLFAMADYGLVGHYNGTEWSPQGADAFNHLTGIWGTSPRDVWVVGQSGTIFRGTR